MGFCRLLCTSLLIFWFTALHAQSEDYRYHRDYLSKFDSYTTEDGLKGRKVLDIYQDRYGFIWIATDKGLNRFDGYDFRVFTHDDLDSSSISNDHVTCITEDIYGNLWIGTQKGLNRYIRESGSFESFFQEDYDDNSLNHDYIRTFYADSSGFLWIETVDGILNRYDISQDRFVHYSHNKIAQPYYEYHAIYEDRRGDLWIGGRSMGPYRFLKQEERFVFYQASGEDPAKKRDNDAAAFLEDRYDNFWISGIDGIYRFFPEEERFEKFYGTSTFDILEDKEGYIWFATGSGVLRFDPRTRELLHYRYEQNNPQSLNEDEVNCMFEDHSGNVWFGTNNGLNKYSRNKYKFSHIYHIPGNEKTIAGNHISSMMLDDRDNLWIGTLGYGLDKMSLEDNRITHYKETIDDSGGLASNYVSDLYQDSKGDIWVGLWRGIGFNKYIPSRDAFVLYSHNPDNLKTDWYVDFLEDRRGTFWAGLWGASGMQEFNRDEGRFEPRVFNPLNSRPIDMRISAIAYAHHGRVWIGCGNISTLYRYSYQDEKMGKVYYKPREHLCSNSDVRAMHSLQNGDSWIASSEGLIRYDHNEQRFRCYGKPGEANYITDMTVSPEDSLVWINTDRGGYIFSTATKAFSPLNPLGDEKKVVGQAIGPGCIYLATSDHVYCYKWQSGEFEKIKLGTMDFRIIQMLYDHQYLYLGTDQGLVRFDFRSGKMESFKKDRNNPAGNLITVLFKDKEGIIWIGSTQGLFRFDPDQVLFESYNADPQMPNTLVNDYILSLDEGLNGDIWIGTVKGLCVFNKNTGKFISYNNADRYSLTSRLTSVIFEDSEGYLWVGTSNKGLNRINLFTGIVDHFRYMPDDTSSLCDDAVNCIFEDSGGTIWIGTEQGLNRFIGVNSGFQQYTTRHGLPDNNIMAILEGNDRDLWISTQNGLVQLNRQGTVIATYFNSDGLQSNRFTGAHCRLPDGRLAFGGENGITVFNPENIIKNTNKPQLQITAFDKFDRTIRTDFTSTKRISLNHNDNFFTIHFSSMDFTAPEKNQYAYKLEGVDKKWMYLENSNHTSYTDIDPGTYIFKVKGSNNDKMWNHEPVSLQIRINPPFWRTSWFLALMFFIIASVIFVYVRLRIIGLKQEKFNVELEQRLLRSQMNPHFIFNSLTSIQNFILGEQPRKANYYLVKFSKLLRFILSNSRTNLITLSEEIQTIEHYLTLQKIRYDQSFEYSLKVDESLHPDHVLIPPMLTQPFVENAIEHGFKLTEYPGRLTIRYELTGSDLRITIEDNGIGIERSQQFKEKIQNTHQSLATKITTERIWNLNRFGKNKIRLEIQDLGHNEEDKNGTKVYLWIPYMLKDGSIREPFNVKLQND